MSHVLSFTFVGFIFNKFALSDLFLNASCSNSRCQEGERDCGCFQLSVFIRKFTCSALLVGGGQGDGYLKRKGCMFQIRVRLDALLDNLDSVVVFVVYQVANADR